MNLYFLNITRFIWILGFIILISTSNVMAQASLPEFSLSQDFSESENDTSANQPQEQSSKISIKRPLTRDILMMQEQINILKALVLRQAELSKIANNYEKMGIPFVQPAPKKAVCEKLPLNILCLYSYPNMDNHKEIIDSTTQRFEIRQNQRMQEAIALITEQMAQNPSPVPSIASDIGFEDVAGDGFEQSATDMDFPLAPVNRYAWSDIRCIQSKCTALLVSILDNNETFRVNKSDKIDENMVIVDIKPTKVIAEKDGERITLEPLALDGRQQIVSVTKNDTKDSETTKKQQKPRISNIINDVLGDDKGQKSDNVGVMTAPEPDISLESPDNSGELLGPTGLF